MTLDDLSEEIETAYSTLEDEYEVTLDRETKNELAILFSAMGTEDVDELIRRGIHMLFQTTVETGNMDFHLRRKYDITYDEYLSGMTYDEMRGGEMFQSSTDDDRRYQF